MGDGRFIGSGQSGEVLAVEGEDVVIKRYVPSETYSADQFRQEIVNARTAHAIIPDGSPEVLDSDDDRKNERPWFAMTRVKPVYGPCPKKTAIAHILKLLDLCIRLRDAGWLHGDIKVENLCLVNGLLGLIDFASMMPVEVANTHNVRTGSDFYRAPETDCDQVFDERTEIHAIAVTFVKLASWPAIVRYAVPLVRSLMPFPWLRYQTFEDFKRGIEREPQRIGRLVWISAAVWKTRIVATHAAQATFATLASLILVGGVSYTAIRFNARCTQQMLRQTEHDYKKAELLLNDKKYDQAVELLIPIAECECRRTPQACLLLADCYQRGLGVKPNETKSLEYKRRYDASRQRANPTATGW